MTVMTVTVMEMECTLDELVVAVASRLAAAGLDCQGNGQVSAVPDRRTLRYYTTIGLLDRPDAVRHRQAIYGERHVSQAVAVKRLQAAGWNLAAIQARLAGLPPAAVEAIASGLPSGSEDRRRFWSEPPPIAVPAPSESHPDGAVRPMLAISLTANTTLLLATERTLSPAEVAAIRAAAAGLVEHLERKDLS
jgi:DNA-binding transcriptional MerR regulator